MTKEFGVSGRAIVLALVAAALLPGVASAATAEITTEIEYDAALDETTQTQRLEYEAAPGELNAVTVRREGESLVAHDDNAAITPGTGCSAIDERTVTCRATEQQRADAPNAIPGYAATLTLGDGNDSALLELARATALGGPGDDRITAGPNAADASLIGDDGDDTLLGGPNDDRLDAGAGNDTLVAGAGGDDLSGGVGFDALRGEAGDDVLRASGGGDTYDGGDDSDTIGLTAADGPAGTGTVDLRVPGPQPALDGGTLVAIENALAETGRYVLVGNDGPNRLETARGKVDGRGGDDVLSGQVAIGGAGEDVVLVAKRRVACGDGYDVVQAVRARWAPAGATCEAVRFDAIELQSSARMVGGRLALKGRVVPGIDFDYRNNAGPPLGLAKFRVHEAGGRRRLLAKGRVRFPKRTQGPGVTRTLALTRRGRAVFGRGRHPAVRITGQSLFEYCPPQQGCDLFGPGALRVASF